MQNFRQTGNKIQNLLVNNNRITGNMLSIIDQDEGAERKAAKMAQVLAQ